MTQISEIRIMYLQWRSLPAISE